MVHTCLPFRTLLRLKFCFHSELLTPNVFKKKKKKNRGKNILFFDTALIIYLCYAYVLGLCCVNCWFFYFVLEEIISSLLGHNSVFRKGVVIEYYDRQGEPE